MGRLMIMRPEKENQLEPACNILLLQKEDVILDNGWLYGVTTPRWRVSFDGGFLWYGALDCAVTMGSQTGWVRSYEPNCVMECKYVYPAPESNWDNPMFAFAGANRAEHQKLYDPFTSKVDHDRYGQYSRQDIIVKLCGSATGMVFTCTQATLLRVYGEFDRFKLMDDTPWFERTKPYKYGATGEVEGLRCLAGSLTFKAVASMTKQEL